MATTISKRTRTKAVPLPDFYSNDFCTAGTYDYTNVLGDSALSASLYNNDSMGRNLYVYGLTFALDQALCAAVYWLQGTFGTFYANGANIQAAVGAPPGVTYTDRNVIGFPYTDPGPPAGAQFLTTIGVEFDANVVIFADYPLFIIPPSWSLLLQNRDPVASFSTGFWYLVAKPG